MEVVILLMNKKKLVVVLLFILLVAFSAIPLASARVKTRGDTRVLQSRRARGDNKVRFVFKLPEGAAKDGVVRILVKSGDTKLVDQDVKYREGIHRFVVLVPKDRITHGPANAWLLNGL